MNLELMRISMWPHEDLSAAEARDASGKIVTREQWMRDIFSKQIEFRYRGKSYYFVPILGGLPSPFIAGRIGLAGLVHENKPPEDGLVDTLRERWTAILVLLDPRAHTDGQKAAVEYGTGVANPFKIFRQLLAHINQMNPPPLYDSEAEIINASRDFMSYVSRNEGQITSVTFEILAPNMFGVEDDMEREADELKRNERARRASLKLENPSGLRLETERVRQAARYTARGGGSIKAFAPKERFNSERAAARVQVPEDGTLNEITEASLRTRIVRAIRYVFQQ